MLRLDPGNVVTLNNLGNTEQGIGGALWSAGHIRESIPHYLKSITETEQAIPGGSGFAMVTCYFITFTAYQQAQAGDFAGAEATLAVATPIWTKLYKTEPADSIEPTIADASAKIGEGGLALERGDAAGARRLILQQLERVQPLKPKSGLQEFQKYATLFFADTIAGQAAYQLGDYAGAERALRGGIEAREKWPTESTSDHRDRANLSIWLALALARQGHAAQALQAISPVIKFQRELASRNHGDRWQPVELASALYVQALADKTHSAQNLREAESLLDGVPAAMRDMRVVRQWRDGVHAAMARSAG
jgi:tetratricopeptide (TPR) repeat protein